MKKFIIFIILFLVLIAGSFIIFKFLPNKHQTPSNKTTNVMIKITSSAFVQNEMIPQKYTCDGQDINPPLGIDDLLSGTKSLALIVDDPDTPGGTWTHWLVWNITPGTKEIKENSLPEGSVLGTNDFGKLEYGGPCPPSGVHRYFFKIYALDTMLTLNSGAKRKDLEQAMEKHILEQGELIARYQRH